MKKIGLMKMIKLKKKLKIMKKIRLTKKVKFMKKIKLNLTNKLKKYIFKKIKDLFISLKIIYY